MRKFICFCAVVLGSFISLSASAVSLNDFSVLLPLPSDSEIPLLLKPADVGARGPLIPLEVYAKLPQLIPESSNKVTYESSLRLLAIRLDPCFVEGPPMTPCRRQIRFVWQPLEKAESLMSTRDAAVHTFYEFDPSMWREILSAWSALDSGKPADPLQVHPVIKTQTLRGPYWQRMRSILLKYCGAQTMVRATAMTIRGGERIWTFAGFDVQQNIIKPIVIPRVNTDTQIAALDIGRKTHFFGAVQPEPREDTLFFKFLRNSELAKTALSEAEFKSIMAKAFDYENPKVHNTATLDCVSCHMAESARRWGQNEFTSWNWAADFKDRFPNPWFNPNQNRANFNPSLFRAFGYLNHQPIVSQRTYNETFEVAKSITAR